jgi:hypothetical protein
MKWAKTAFACACMAEERTTRAVASTETVKRILSVRGVLGIDQLITEGVDELESIETRFGPALYVEYLLGKEGHNEGIVCGTKECQRKTEGVMSCNSNELTLQPQNAQSKRPRRYEAKVGK